MHKKGNIAAFTLFEIMMVLAITGVLITIVSVSLNRFNEQMKLSSALQSELNQWYVFRSNLWHECYTADSLDLKDAVLSIHGRGQTVQYRIEVDSLLRSGNNTPWKRTGFLAERIFEQNEPQGSIYGIDFLWKGETMRFSYMNCAARHQFIDQYFEKI